MWAYLLQFYMKFFNFFGWSSQLQLNFKSHIEKYQNFFTEKVINSNQNYQISIVKFTKTNHVQFIAIDFKVLDNFESEKRFYFLEERKMW